MTHSPHRHQGADWPQDLSPRCYLLPTRPQAGFPHLDLLNQTFLAWKTCWLEVARQTAFSFNVDDFYRQNAVLSLVSPQGEIMGCNLYSFFNLKNQCSTETHYFSRFDQDTLNYLATRQFYNMFTFEYLTVTSAFRRNRQWPLGRSIISLSCKVLENSPFDAVLAQTRDDININKICLEAGCHIISSDRKMHNIDSSFVVFERGKTKPSPNGRVRAVSESLWQTMEDFTGITHKGQDFSLPQPSPHTKEVAA